MSFWSRLLDNLFNRRPTPAPPAPAPLSRTVMVAITMRVADGTSPAVHALLVLDDGESCAATGSRPVFEIPRGSLGHGGSLHIAPDDEAFATRTARVVLPRHDHEGMFVPKDGVAFNFDDPTTFDTEYVVSRTPPKPKLWPLVVDGLNFSELDGTPWTQIGCSDFQLLQRFLAGEDIDPILDERIALGFNQLRVFLMCHGMFHLYPMEHDGYFVQLQAFVQRCAAKGLRLELTVFVDATQVMPSLEAQKAFWVLVVTTLRNAPSVFLELVNEVDQTINVIATEAFARPSGIICSHGSKGVVNTANESMCVIPVWDYGSGHPARDEGWPRYGHNLYEDIALRYHVPATDNEACRPDQGRGPVISDFFDAAVNIAVMCAGGTFHCDGGKASRLFTATERDCARAWTAGARIVDQSLQDGRYVAGHLTGFPIQWQPGDSVRAHGRILGNRGMLSLPQMRPDFTSRPVDGWRVSKWVGSYVEVVR